MWCKCTCNGQWSIRWSVVGQLLVSCWSVVGQLLVSCWSVVGQLLVSCWSVVGQLLVSYWSVVGQLLVSCWPLPGWSHNAHCPPCPPGGATSPHVPSGGPDDNRGICRPFVGPQKVHRHLLTTVSIIIIMIEGMAH